ncbi:hypothetical protein B4Q04_17520 [Zobellia sp. OII3]|nr:hypothetical protein B4Q04_17520 [Zobellia sp. OII3]
MPPTRNQLKKVDLDIAKAEYGLKIHLTALPPKGPYLFNWEHHTQRHPRLNNKMPLRLAFMVMLPKKHRAYHKTDEYETKY